MAKINGVQLKCIKEWTGTDGYGLDATIYLDNKEVGIIHDGADGSEVVIVFEEDGTESEIKKRADRYFGEETGRIHDLLEEVLTLQKREKMYKALIKRGYQHMAVAWNERLGQETQLGWNGDNCPDADEWIKTKRETEEMRVDEYHDLDDFVVETELTNK